MKDSIKAKKLNDRTKFNFFDLFFILGACLFVVSILVFTLINFNTTVSGMAYVEIRYYTNIIYKQPLYVEYDPLIIEKKDGINGNPEKNITGIGKEFDFVGERVAIKIKDNTIQVVEEQSEYNICSFQGVVKNANYPIICLPNHLEVIIKNENPDAPDN